MANRTFAATNRTRAISQHMSASTQAGGQGNADEVRELLPGRLPLSLSVNGRSQPAVLFENVGQIRKYILNRPKKLNALNESMLNILRPQIEVSLSLVLISVRSGAPTAGMVPRGAR